MKKALPFWLLLLTSCASQKQSINNHEVLKLHKAPLKVSNIGFWGQNQRVLTLSDANNTYYTIRTLRNDSIRVGDVYHLEE